MKRIIGEFIALVFFGLFSLALPVELRLDYIIFITAYFIIANLLFTGVIKADFVTNPLLYAFSWYGLRMADFTSPDVIDVILFVLWIATLVFLVYVWYGEYVRDPPRFGFWDLAGFWINASASSVVYYIFAGVGPPLLLSLLLASVLHVGTRGAGHAYVVPWLSSLLSLATPSWGSALAATPYVVAAVAYRMTASRTEPHKHAS